MGLLSFLGCISLLFIMFNLEVTDYKPHVISAFHQNYPEFDNEDDIKDLYNILKDSPYFKSKIIQLESIANEVSRGCNIDTLSLEETETKANDTEKTNLEICDGDIEAMKAECDKHYNVMEYCNDKSDFMTSYIVTRNLTDESAGKVASVLP